MSNAMRTGKRTLAGMAAGALGLALIPFIGVGSAQAAQTLAVDGNTPSRAGFLGTTLTINNSEAILGDAARYVLVRIDSAPTSGATAATFNNGGTSNAYSVNPGTGAGALITGATDGATGTVFASPAISSSVLANVGVDVSIASLPSLAGTYTFTAWLTAASNTITNAGGAVPGAGVPFVTGSFAVGSQPAAAAVTPTSATYAASTGAVSALTVLSLTDSSGRPTALSTLETVAVAQANGTGVTNLNINSSGASQVGVIGNPDNVNLLQGGYPVPVNIGAVGVGTYSLVFAGTGTLTGLVTPATFGLSIVSGTAGTGLAVTPAANLYETTPVASQVNKTWNISVPSAAAPVSTFTVTAKGAPGSGVSVYLGTGSSVADNASPKIAVNGQTYVTSNGNLPASIGATATLINAVADSSGTATFAVTITGPSAGKTVALSNAVAAVTGSGVSSAILTYVSSTAADDVETAINSAVVDNQSVTPLLVAKDGSITISTTVVNGLAAGLSGFLLRAGTQATVDLTNSTLDTVISQGVTSAAGTASVTIPAPTAGTTSATYKVVVTTTNPANLAIASGSRSSYELTVTYTDSGSPASISVINATGSLVPTLANTLVYPPSSATLGAAATSSATTPTPGDYMLATASLPSGVNNLITFTGTEGLLFATSTESDVNEFGDSLTVATSGSSVQVRVIGTKTGEATVTATSGTTTQSVKLTITPAVANGARNLAISAPARASSGDYFNATVTVTDGWGNPVRASGTAPFVSLANISLTASGPAALQSGTAVTTTTAEGTFTFLVFAPTGLTGVATLGVLASGNNTYQLTGAAGAVLPVDAPVVGFAASVNSANAAVDVTTAATKSIVITGERATVSGRSGIMVDGIVTGIEDGKTVVPYIRFPGQTTFTAGSARPEITDGEFVWQRKTGKRVTVFVTNEDGDIRSNRVTIQAN